MKKLALLLLTFLPFGKLALAQTPELFVPGVISSPNPEFAATLSPDGRQFFFNRTSPDRRRMYLMWSEKSGDGWSQPTFPALTDTSFNDIDPFISPDGRWLFFSSNRPLEGSQSKDYDLWSSENQGGKWLAPKQLDSPANTAEDEIFCSLTASNDLYFARFWDRKAKIFHSHFQDGKYQTATQLSLPGTDTSSISNPAISPDGLWLVFASGELGGKGSADLFASRNLGNGRWSSPVNLEPANSAFADFAPAFSPDGKYLFFTSERPGVVQDFPEGKRRPGDLYRIGWADIAPTFKAYAELPPNEPVVFTAKDGVRVFGNLFPAEGGNRQPLILLFHQAASNGLAEYQNIIPQLLGMGYHLLVVDLREGSGETYGGENRTAKAWKNASPDAYCAAYADVEAALAFAEARGFSAKKILWGSGYSAALAIQLAVNQSDKVDGVLAFAPAQGGSITPCEPTEALLSKLKKPLIVFRCEEELKQPNRQAQADMFRKMGILFIVAAGRRHGASVLDATRNEGSVEGTWEEVRRFLRGIGN